VGRTRTRSASHGVSACFVAFLLPPDEHPPRPAAPQGCECLEMVFPSISHTLGAHCIYTKNMRCEMPPSRLESGDTYAIRGNGAGHGRWVSNRARFGYSDSHSRRRRMLTSRKLCHASGWASSRAGIACGRHRAATLRALASRQACEKGSGFLLDASLSVCFSSCCCSS